MVVPGLTAAAVSAAFFVLFAHDIDGPAFPHAACGSFDCSRYNLFVVSPLNVTRRHVDELRRVGGGEKDAIVLGYFDTLHVPIRSGCATGHSFGDHPGKNCSQYGQCGDGPYLKGLRDVFPPSMATHRAANGSVVCSYPGLADHVAHDASVTALVPYLAGVAQEAGFDGWYLDNRLSPALFARSAVDAQFGNTTAGSAVRAGWATTASDAVAMYSSWGGALTSGLRAALGPDAVLIGNSGGALSDPALNGLTLEMEACVRQNCTDAVLAQRAVGHKPDVGVFWLTHAEAMPPAEQCQRVKAMQKALPWMRAGTDFIDLSHIVCNNSAAAYS